MIMGVTPTVSGPGVGALAAGVGSILVTMIELCFGLVGASGGWGPAVAGAFAVLAGALAIGAVTLGSVSLRQIRRARATGGMRGRGQALGGIVSVRLASPSTSAPSGGRGHRRLSEGFAGPPTVIHRDEPFGPVRLLAEELHRG